MHENRKLEEAKYFLAQLEGSRERRDEFRFNLSAFLSSARSVLQYAREEATTKQGGQVWYDEAVAKRATVSFFKDRRDVNIHEEPVDPSAQITASMTETVGFSDSVKVKVTRADGTVEESETPDEDAEAERATSQESNEDASSESSVTYEYYFADWSGNEEVVDLCKKYLDELEDIVDEGMRKGFVSG